MVLKSVDNNVERSFEITIQPAVLEDTKAMSQILTRSFYNFPDFIGWMSPFLRFTIAEDLRYRLRSHSPRYSCFVAKLASTDSDRQQIEDSDLNVVGTIEIALRSLSLWSNHDRYPYISNLAVHHDFRRLGIGSQLLTKCEQVALDWGYRETRLHVLDSNTAAKQLYCNNNYQISQIEANWGNLWFDYSPRLLLKKQIQTS